LGCPGFGGEPEDDVVLAMAGNQQERKKNAEGDLNLIPC